MHRLAALLLVALPWQATAECECLWDGGFADVQAGTDLVVAGTVGEARGNYIDFSVERALRGEPYTDAVRVWLKTGDYCRPEPELFPVGSRWVMALDRIDALVPGGFNPSTPNISYGRVGDFSLSSCGGYWLLLEGDVVTGNLVDAPRWDREPKMTPVRLDLLEAYVRGDAPRENLSRAAREDPALRQLMLDTRAFTRDGE